MVSGAAISAESRSVSDIESARLFEPLHVDQMLNVLGVLQQEFDVSVQPMCHEWFCDGAVSWLPR